MRVVDEQFVAFEHEAGAAFARGHRDAVFAPASVRLQMRGRGDQFAARDRRQEATLLLLGAGAAYRLGKHQRPDEWRRQQDAAHLLGHHHQIDVVESGAAMLLGQHQAEPSEAGHLAPQLR